MTPFEMLGGEAVARQVAAAFYDRMDRDEPALARLHELDSEGRVHPDNRERFALFFVGWLGGPQTYIEQHGHPRLRMRHQHVPIDGAMRDAWMRAMRLALDDVGVSGDIRRFLEEKLQGVADFMINVP